MSSAEHGEIYTDPFRTADDGRPKAVAIPAPPAAARKPPARMGWTKAVVALTILGAGFFYVADLRGRVDDLAERVTRLETDLAAASGSGRGPVRALRERSAPAN